MTPGKFFAPVPARAIADRRLSGLHLRTLMCIAWHDRMHRHNCRGEGFWPTTRSMAAHCGCDFSNFCTAVTDLARWGYGERKAHPLDHRLRVYRVIFHEALDLGEVTP